MRAKLRWPIQQRQAAARSIACIARRRLPHDYFSNISK